MWTMHVVSEMIVLHRRMEDMAVASKERGTQGTPRGSNPLRWRRRASTC